MAIKSTPPKANPIRDLQRKILAFALENLYIFDKIDQAQWDMSIWQTPTKLVIEMNKDDKRRNRK